MSMRTAVQELARSHGVRATFEALDQDLDVSVGSALHIADALRTAGVACAAYRLPEGTPTGDLPPSIVAREGGWCLEGSEADGTDPALASVIIGEPPVGSPYVILREGDEALAPADIGVWLFYASPADDAELAEQQVLPDLEAILDRAREEGARPIFVDSVGLIRDRGATVGVSDSAAFQRAMISLRAQAKELRAPSGFHSDAQSPMWQAIYAYLGERRDEVSWVTEDLRWRLQERIVRHDLRKLGTQALNHFAAGQIDEAADVMTEQIATFHELNCLERNRRLAHQIEQIIEERGSEARIVVIREIGHVNSLETLLPTSLGIQTKIVATEPLHVLFARMGMETAVGNFGVVPTQDNVRLRALRQCIKCALPATPLRGLSLSAGARLLASTCIDALSEQSVREILDRLHAPVRVFLRNTPHAHAMGKQLQYLLVDLGVIPPELLEDPAAKLLQRFEAKSERRLQ